MRNLLLKTHPLADEEFGAPLASLFEPWRALWSQAAATTPQGMPLEILDMENEVMIRAELPGVGKENIHVSHQDQTLTIMAEKKVTAPPTEQTATEKEGPEQAPPWRVLRNERSEGVLERRLRLPFPVDFDSASAKYIDGVLNLRLPKAQSKNGHRITVN